MPGIAVSQDHLEDADLGTGSLELIALRYTGDNTSLAVSNHLNNEGSWPSMATLQGSTDGPGPWYYALVPDDGLAHLENRPDVEILYATDRERFAKVLLNERRLPENAFGTQSYESIRERVFDVLGLKPAVQGGPIRDQLRDIAGIDETEDDGEDDTELVQHLMDEHSRSVLGDLCKELRDDASEFDLRDNQSKTARAEFVAAADDDARSSAIEAVTDTGDADGDGDGGDD